MKNMKRIFCTAISIGVLIQWTVAQNDPLYHLQAAPAHIGLPAVWTGLTTGGVTVEGDTIVVAIIDDGFDLGHEDLKSNFWKNRSEIPNNGIDDEGNTYMDDYHGWNAYNSTGNVPAANHGTVVSGIIGAKGNNGTGVCGINWNIKMLPVGGSSSDTEVVRRAVDYIIKMRQLYHQTSGQKGAFIVAVNFSFGPSILSSPTLADDLSDWRTMIEDLGSVGILSCQAAGNNGINLDQIAAQMQILHGADHHILVKIGRASCRERV